MCRLHAGLWPTLTLAATLVASPVCAQTVAASFDELRGLVKAAELLTVLDETGAKTTGKLFELSGSSLVLLTKEKKRDGVGREREEWTGRRSFSETAVAEITRTDSLRNGTLIGLGAGSAMLAISLANLLTGAGFECGSPVFCVAILASPAIGAAVGAGVDASQGRATIYRSSSPAPRQTLVVSPLMGLRSVGVSLAAAFRTLRAVCRIRALGTYRQEPSRATSQRLSSGAAQPGMQPTAPAQTGAAAVMPSVGPIGQPWTLRRSNESIRH